MIFPMIIKHHTTKLVSQLAKKRNLTEVPNIRLILIRKYHSTIID